MPRRLSKSASTRGLGRVPAALIAAAVTLALPQGALARAADADHDGLGDRYERRHTHTNPHKADSDGDGLRDKFEHRRSRTSPRRKDTDKDGLSDGYEVKRSKSSPRRRDTDKDGLSDGYEVRRSKSSPRRADSEQRRPLDTPSEAVQDLTEQADEDGDGLSDGVEVLFGLDPLHGPGDEPGAGSPAPGPGTPPVDAPPPDTPPPGTPPPEIPPPLPDLIPPATTITAGPSGTVTTASATFSFRSSEPGSTFQCRIDAVPGPPARRRRRIRGWWTDRTSSTYGLATAPATRTRRPRSGAGPSTCRTPPPPPPPTGSADVFVSTAGSDASGLHRGGALPDAGQGLRGGHGG